MRHSKRLRLTCCLFVVCGVYPGIAAAGGGSECPGMSEKVMALRKTPVFQALNEAQLGKVAAISEVVVFPGGSRIIEQGSRTRKMAVVLDSDVRIQIDGECVTILPARSLVGEIEFLEDVPATADVVLLDRSRVLLMDHAGLLSVMDADTDLGYRLMREIARMEAHRLRGMAQREPR